jgi:hypothetical protein
LALASGCTVGVVRSNIFSVIKSSVLFCRLWPFFFYIPSQIPAVMTDRFARKNYGYDGMDCFAFSTVEKPPQCRQGSQDAQNFSAVSSFISNTITYVSSFW